MRRTPPRGFTLMELMLSLVILAILGTIAVNEFRTQVMLARRTEAIEGLAALWTAQQLQYSERGSYASVFPQLAFGTERGVLLSPTSYKGGRYTYQLSQPWGSTSYYCIATAQLDADPWPDILEIYEFGE